MVFPLVIYGCESWTIKKAWVPKNWCFWAVAPWKTLESPLDYKKIKPVKRKGNQPWIFIRKTDAEAEAPILWPLDEKSRLNGKDLDPGKDWRQEEEGTTEDEMVGWHHITDSMDMNLNMLWVKDREAWCSAVHGDEKSWTWLSDWARPLPNWREE